MSHEQFQRNPNSIPIVVNDGTVVDGIRVIDPNPPTDQWFAQRADGAKTGFYGTFYSLEYALFRETIVWKRQPTESGKILDVVERTIPIMAGTVDNQMCTLHYNAVCISGAVGDYAVYVGAGSTEWIRDNGTKLSFEEASIHFPGLKKERYRGG